MPQLTEQDVKRIYQDSTPVARAEFRFANNKLTNLIRTAHEQFRAYIAEQFAMLNAKTDAAIARLDKRVSELKDGDDAEPLDHEQVVKDVLAGIRQPEDGETPVIDYGRIAQEAAALIPPPKDGIDADVKAILAQVLAEIDKRVPLLGDALRAGLEAHVKDTVAQQAPYWSGGNAAVAVMQSGTLKAHAAPTLDFKGAGAPTVSVDSVGVTHLDFAASAGFTTLAATETPNGSATVFTFSSATAQPSFIVADNVWLRATTKSGTVNWTWNGGTKKATLTIAPQDEIFAIV
jgi:hypothetical protein